MTSLTDCEHTDDEGNSTIKKEHITTFGDNSREAFICEMCNEEFEDYEEELKINNAFESKHEED